MIRERHTHTKINRDTEKETERQTETEIERALLLLILCTELTCQAIVQMIYGKIMELIVNIGLDDPK